jgi:spoIIIJ-associated protein
MSHKIDTLIKDLITKTSFHVEDIVVSYDNDTDSTWYTIKTSEPRVFIGRDGETLMALNHLVKRLIEKNSEQEIVPQYIIDVDDFQKRKIDNLKAIAHMMAERARYFKSTVEIDPMGSYERKIIHSFLQTKPDLKSESVGEGRERRVTIKYIGSI